MPSMRQSEHINAFVDLIWAWYTENKRELPWRDLQVVDDTQRAYLVLVSEVMLQQTQVPRVIVIYKRFLEQFPTLEDLAEATNSDVIRAWRGMGYNSRALRLRDAARSILDDYQGVFPKEMNQLLLIKGIGEYTAAAVRNFAFQLPTPCLDTNIRRILHRVFIGPENPDGTWPTSDKELLKIAEKALSIAIQHPKYTTADWHAALMDFGSLVCTKRAPKWEQCPLTAKKLCKAAYKVQFDPAAKKIKQEPGREMGGRFIPNRIFRGRVIDELRDESNLLFDDIGRRICLDWSPVHHTKWLQGILADLQKDQLIKKSRTKYFLPT